MSITLDAPCFIGVLHSFCVYIVYVFFKTELDKIAAC